MLLEQCKPRSTISIRHSRFQHRRRLQRRGHNKMGFIGPILSALAAAFNVWRQERAIYNSPDEIKNKIAIGIQQSTDAVRNAEAKLANPASTLQEHADALRQLRLAAS